MARHRKTLRLSKNLNISRREAIGLLVDLWTWGIDNADKNGLLAGLEAEDIAAALDYPRKRGDEIVNAIDDAGYIDKTSEGYVLHDWYEYCGKLNEKREDTKRRVEAYRSNKKKPVTNALRNADVTRTVTQDVTQCNASTVPNRTVPSIYIPTLSKSDVVVSNKEADNDHGGFASDADVTAYQESMAAVESLGKQIGIDPWTQSDTLTAERLIADYTAVWVLEAMNRASKGQASCRSWRYIEGILKNWRTKGGIDSEAAPKADAAIGKRVSHQQYTQRQYGEIDPAEIAQRIIREERGVDGG